MIKSDSRQKIQLLQYSLGLLASLLVVELSVGVFSHSLALLADAQHVLFDMMAIALALLVVWRSRQPVDGWQQKKLEAIAALVNGLSLLVVGGWTVWESVIRLQVDDHQILGLPMLTVAVLGLVVNGINVGYLHNCCGEDLSTKSALVHLWADLLGSVGAMAAAIAVTWLGWHWADGVVSIIVSGIVGFLAISLINQSWQKWQNPLYSKTQCDENCRCLGEQILFPSLQESIDRQNHL